MCYSPKVVANYFINLVQDPTPLKIQKLVYYAHSAYLAFKDKPLINEPVQAWSYVPVVSSLYQAMKQFGNTNINCLLEDFPIKSIPNNDEETIEVLNNIYEAFGKLTPIQIMNLTHTKGEAWTEIYEKYNHNIPLNTTIPNETMKECFKQKYCIS